MRVKWSGFQTALQGLKDAEDLFPEAVGVGLYLEGEQIMSQSKRETPVDTGRLRSTGYVAPPVRRGTQILVVLGYGTNYAVFVHENLQARHKVGKAKYLQDPLEAAYVGLGMRVAKRAAEYIERGGKGFRPGRVHPTRPAQNVGIGGR